jgi:hypothetical protein
MFWKGRFYFGDDGSQNFKITDKNPSEPGLKLLIGQIISLQGLDY